MRLELQGSGNGKSCGSQEAEREFGLGLKLVCNLKVPPVEPKVCQLGLISKWYHSFPKPCHQLGTSCSNTRAGGWYPLWDTALSAEEFLISMQSSLSTSCHHNEMFTPCLPVCPVSMGIWTYKDTRSGREGALLTLVPSCSPSSVWWWWLVHRRCFGEGDN